MRLRRSGEDYLEAILILASPTHVPFEGNLQDKKTPTGHGVFPWRGEELPVVRADFSRWKTGKYYRHPVASHPVTGMRCAYYDPYRDKVRVEAVMLCPERSGNGWPQKLRRIFGETEEM